MKRKCIILSNKFIQSFMLVLRLYEMKLCEHWSWTSILYTVESRLKTKSLLQQLRQVKAIRAFLIHNDNVIINQGATK